MAILLSVVVIFLVALAAPFLNKLFKGAAGWVLSLVPLSIFAYFISLIPLVSAGEVIKESHVWVSYLGINMSFYVDGLSLLFALIITGVGTFILIYGGGYLHGHHQIGRFYLSVLLFMGSMLGVVLADNIISMFVFWELTSISSYLLIGFNHEKEDSRKAALQALLVTGSGGLAMLAGAIILVQITGTMEMSEMLNATGVAESPLYLGMLILILAGCFTKSAQFPFHFWLPGAMAAPTPVSAYLHSATMVKAGVYLMARLNPVIGGTEIWFYTLTSFGAATMIIGAWLALCHTDLKRVLAYSTVMALGTLTMLIGMGHEYAMKAAAVFLLGHSMYKGALFMVAGSIDHEAGTRDVRMLGGLRKLMPYTATFAAIAALSMAGVAPMLGFIGKELVYEAALSVHAFPLVLITIAVVANIAIVASCGIVAIRPFYGEQKETPKHAHEAPISMWLGPAFLSVFSLVFGVLPFLIDQSIISKASAAIGGTPDLVFSLSLWHGINAALILSIVTFLSGVGVYFIWDKIRDGAGLQGFGKLFGQVPEKGYDHLLSGMLSFAGIQTRFFQNGNLRYYLITILGLTIALFGFTLFTQSGTVIPTDFSSIYAYEWVLALVIVTSAFVALRAESGLVAIAALGVMGYSIALIYVLFSAPDLAITQVLVETLTVILVALVLIHIPKAKMQVKPSSKLRDGIIAGSVGLLVTLILFAVLDLEFDPYMSEFFAENSYVIAKGRNIVNVILVDFRALDTLGEIVVIGVAGIGIYGLIKLGKSVLKKEEA